MGDIISRDTLVKVTNLLGWPPEDVLELDIRPHEVVATLWERDENGKKLYTYSYGVVVGPRTYRQTVPVA